MRNLIIIAISTALILAGLASPASAEKESEDSDMVCQLQLFKDGDEDSDAVPLPSYILLDIETALYFYRVSDEHVTKDGAICNELSIEDFGFYIITSSKGSTEIYDADDYRFKFAGFCDSEGAIEHIGTCDGGDDPHDAFRTIEKSDVDASLLEGKSNTCIDDHFAVDDDCLVEWSDDLEAYV